MQYSRTRSFFSFFSSFFTPILITSKIIVYSSTNFVYFLSNHFYQMISYVCFIHSFLSFTFSVLLFFYFSQEHIHNDECVLVFGYSSTLEYFLKAAARKRRFQVRSSTRVLHLHYLLLFYVTFLSLIFDIFLQFILLLSFLFRCICS